MSRSTDRESTLNNVCITMDTIRERELSFGPAARVIRMRDYLLSCGKLSEQNEKAISNEFSDTLKDNIGDWILLLGSMKVVLPDITRAAWRANQGGSSISSIKELLHKDCSNCRNCQVSRESAFNDHADSNDTASDESLQ